MHRAGKLPARNLANIVHGFASMQHHPGHALLGALAAQARKQLPHFITQTAANIMWAFAKLKHSPDAALLRGCEAHAVRAAGAFIPQELVRCCFLSTSVNFAVVKCRWTSCFQLVIFNADTGSLRLTEDVPPYFQPSLSSVSAQSQLSQQI